MMEIHKKEFHLNPHVSPIQIKRTKKVGEILKTPSLTSMWFYEHVIQSSASHIVHGIPETK